jgi:hypothetical protein
MSKNLRIQVILSGMIQLTTIGCVTVPELKEVQTPQTAQNQDSRLRFAWASSKPAPQLIDESEVQLKSNSGQIQIASVRRWDLNRDGNSDMVEFWSKDGVLLGRAIDVEGDGNPDFWVEAAPDSAGRKF